MGDMTPLGNSESLILRQTLALSHSGILPVSRGEDSAPMMALAVWAMRMLRPDSVVFDGR